MYHFQMADSRLKEDEYRDQNRFYLCLERWVTAISCRSVPACIESYIHPFRFEIKCREDVVAVRRSVQRSVWYKRTSFSQCFTSNLCIEKIENSRL